ncbi:hypothetical protein UY3_03696 [Chelonia mydas]|uniref:Uncharacterized protein n=1 Tax=Chelonia mydas TaxID=8469 RepID=M7CE77_CHEMY|nr:hypothetical protein UY3_03696 [Chelonia mydas]
MQHLTREKLISTQKSKENKAPPWLAAELLEKRSVKELHLSEALHLPILGQCTWAEQTNMAATLKPVIKHHVHYPAVYAAPEPGKVKLAIRSRTSCSVHAGALLRFWDSIMVTSADELCTHLQLATLTKQEMKFKSLWAFACLRGQGICVENAVQSGHNGALWDSSRRPIPSNCIHTTPNSTLQGRFQH